ncbi:MAG: sporulation protein YunB [Firmicutes bacterium]|nr:sporulation protein YunB [Oscillospiraceae bacterium]MBS5433206.1 sporulation protein YunB [Bacillota bacterium]
MYYRRVFRRRPRYHYSNPDAPGGMRPRPRGKSFWPLFFLAALLIFLAAAALFLEDLSTQIAVSDASDVVTVRINNAIADIMNSGEYGGDYFVTFEKNDAGEVTAISSNMARINALSAKILDRVVGATENHSIIVEIPIGNLTGVSLLMGRGPKVPVEIIVLTSSRVEFNNSIVTAGINQTKHQINLEVIVDIDILIPWDTESTQVQTEVLIADTIVVGQVPKTYLNMQQTGE